MGREIRYLLRDTIKWTIHLKYSIYGMHLRKYIYIQRHGKYLSHMKQNELICYSVKFWFTKNKMHLKNAPILHLIFKFLIFL